MLHSVCSRKLQRAGRKLHLASTTQPRLRDIASSEVNEKHGDVIAVGHRSGNQMIAKGSPCCHGVRGGEELDLGSSGCSVAGARMLTTLAYLTGQHARGKGLFQGCMSEGFLRTSARQVELQHPGREGSPTCRGSTYSVLQTA